MGMATALLACADPMPVSFSLSTTGSFSSGTPSNINFTGIGTTSTAGFTGTESGGVLSLPDLGTFTLQKPSQGADPYDGDTFTLNLFFFQPTGIVGIGSSADFNATLTGTVNTQQGSVIIDFGPARTFTFSNPDSAGGFDLTINKVTLDIPHGGTASTHQVLQGGITNAFDPPTAPVPEPGSIVLLGSLTLLVVGTIRRRQRVS